MFENMFNSKSAVYNYSTRQADLLYVQYASTKRTQMAFKHFGTKLWNNLYNVINIDCTINTFKHRMEFFPFVMISFHILSLLCIIIPQDKLTYYMFNMLPLKEHKWPLNILEQNCGIIYTML